MTYHNTLVDAQGIACAYCGHALHDHTWKHYIWLLLWANRGSTGCFFRKVPPRKVLSNKYGIGPSQQDKIAKYAGPTQSYQRSKE